MAKLCPYCGFTTDENVSECERCGALMEDVPGEHTAAENEEWFEDDFDEPMQPLRQNHPPRGKRYSPAEGNTLLVLSMVGFCTGIFCVGMILDLITLVLALRWYMEDNSRTKCKIAGIIAGVGFILTILVFFASAYSD